MRQKKGSVTGKQSGRTHPIKGAKRMKRNEELKGLMINRPQRRRYKGKGNSHPESGGQEFQMRES